jgi:hypothetical protein
MDSNGAIADAGEFGEFGEFRLGTADPSGVSGSGFGFGFWLVGVQLKLSSGFAMVVVVESRHWIWGVADADARGVVAVFAQNRRVLTKKDWLIMLLVIGPFLVLLGSIDFVSSGWLLSGVRVLLVEGHAAVMFVFARLLLALSLPVHLTRLFEVVTHLLLLVVALSEFLQLVLTQIPLLILLVYVSLREFF